MRHCHLLKSTCDIGDPPPPIKGPLSVRPHLLIYSLLIGYQSTSYLPGSLRRYIYMYFVCLENSPHTSSKYMLSLYVQVRVTLLTHCNLNSFAHFFRLNLIMYTNRRRRWLMHVHTT